MLDIHSHFLPKMDDGAKDVEESLSMLKASKEQGVSTIISTSHFYADQDSPERFLHRRKRSYEMIEDKLSSKTPNIMFGAEVLYFYGISRADEVKKLAIEGTNLMLIELPFQAWSETMFDELLSFRYASGVEIILAHVERYMDIQKKNVFSQIFDYDFYIQCNAEAFLSRRTKKFAFSLIEEGRLDFIGSDCHSMTRRPPNIEEGKKVFVKKFGESMWNDFCSHSESLLGKHML